MLDINLLREQPDLVRKSLQDRQMDAGVVDSIQALDVERRTLIARVEERKAERNTVSREIGKMKDPTERQAKIDAMRLVGDEIDQLDERIRQVDEDLRTLVAVIPNIPDPQTHYGKDEHDNQVIQMVGEPRTFDFTPLPHWDLGPALGVLDFDRGVKITGSRSYILSGAGARLQRALIAWMLDLHIRQGYEEKYTPFMVRSGTLFASGQLPKFADNLYHDAEEDLWMVPTAEVPLTGMHMEEILEDASLPLRYTAYTPCFRREKMSAGRDVRGIKRVHQFEKVEMYHYTLPEESYAALEEIVANAEDLCRRLGLPHRVVKMCTGDLGFAAAKKYDVEAWVPGPEGQGEWLEISSCSNVEAFQARRVNMRFRREPGARPEFVHTLNGSGLPPGRLMIAVMENYQQADGSIVVPEVLRPYMGGLESIR